MAERRTPRAFAALLVGGLLMAGAAGCRGNPKPVTRAEETPPAEKAAPAPTPSPSATPQQAQAQPPRRDDAPVVVDPGEDGSSSAMTLVEAARQERERRAHAGKPIAVINDKTLAGYAAKGQITVADPKEAKGATPAAAPAAAAGDPMRDEQYWRGRGLEIRLRLGDAAKEVGELEQRSSELRQQFYMENDPLIRDGRIKPDWDRTLDRLRQSRANVDLLRRDLAEFQEEGRLAGALPGWLREGGDEEPAEEPRRREPPAPAQSIEPPVLADPPPGAGGWR